ncbi:MAG: heavy metal translocating P-type ATPase, partial [Thermodesulfobacteriota bacterium]
ESSIAKMLDLVETASARKAATENFITVFARYYTPAMVAAAVAIAVLPPLLMADAAFKTWIYRALVLLVISCPCALVISIPLGYFGGIGRASKRGILVKGSNFIDALSNVKTVVFDKTGTLTEGVFQVDRVVAENGYAPDRILEMAALAEQHSNHPIAKSILDAYHRQQKSGPGKPADPGRVGSHTDISGSGVKAAVDSTDVLVGNDRFMHDENIAHSECAIEGTVAHVAIGGEYAGYILIGDRIRHDAVETISRLRENGVERILMLTGDNPCAADAIAGGLDLDGHYAGLLPEDKVRVFEELQVKYAERGRIAFVGDGINDAPVIARADVGVAMGALGSDAAIETADVVLMKDSPAKMAEAVHIAKQTRVIVWQNIVLALSVKAVFIAFGAFGLASMWAAVFADVGTALMAVVNSTRTLGKKARPKSPEDETRQVGSGASYSTQSV